MGATSKSTRGVPPPQFEDYVLTYETGKDLDLYPVRSSEMSYVPGTAGRSFTGDAILDLGFDFRYENVVYKKIYIYSSGWCYLVDPNRPDSPTWSDVLGSPNLNAEILDVFSYKHLMLCPWFTRSITAFKNVYGHVDVNLGLVNAYLGPIYGDANVARRDILAGRTKYPAGIDANAGGVKFYRGSSSAGRFLLIRWKFFTRYNNYRNVASCDAVIYESGHIAFRYTPCSITRNEDIYGATVGIFSYGGTSLNPRYRDFGWLLKKDAENARKEHVNGGATYNGIFTDTNPSDVETSRYTSSLNVVKNWPGGNVNGAVLRFSPPRYRRRQNRSVVYMRDNADFIRTGGSSLFDDRNVLPSPVVGRPLVVEYPSMIPVASRLQNFDGGPTSGVDLFQSGSIQIERTSLAPDLYDDVLRDSILSGRKR